MGSLQPQKVRTFTNTSFKSQHEQHKTVEIASNNPKQEQVTGLEEQFQWLGRRGRTVASTYNLPSAICAVVLDGDIYWRVVIYFRK